jgi:hypothetical protein
VQEIPREQLQLRLITPSEHIAGQELDGKLDLSWELLGSPVGQLVFLLRYSNDGGQTWRPINPGFGFRGCEVDLGKMRGGDECILQVIATTIWQTATARTVPFRVPRRPRRATILLPSDGETIAKVPAELIGFACAPGDIAPDAELSWWSSAQGALGRGSRLALDRLRAGEHEIILSAPDGIGGQTRACTRLAVQSDQTLSFKAQA